MSNALVDKRDKTEWGWSKVSYVAGIDLNWTGSNLWTSQNMATDLRFAADLIIDAENIGICEEKKSEEGGIKNRNYNGLV